MSKIGIFDSGLGGLTVLNNFLEKYPNNDYIFVSDSKNFPYGEKSKEELLSCASKIISFFLSINVDTIVIACNTLSSLILEDLKRKYSEVNIVGVIESTISKVLEYDNKNVLVLATLNTVNSLVYKNEIERNSNNKVFQVATDLAFLIETESPYLEEKVKDYLSYYKDIDIIVLGCTHYKLVLDIIKKYSNALIVSSSEEVSSFVNLSNDSEGSVLVYTTGDVDVFCKKCKKYFFSLVSFLDL